MIYPLRFLSVCLAMTLASLVYAEKKSEKSWSERIQLPLPEIEVLDNGLRVAWFIDSKLPVVDVALLVQSGHKDDKRGKSGSMRLLAATLDQGVSGKTSAQFAREIESLGASRYVSVDTETVTIGVHGLATDWNKLIDFARRMTLEPDFLQSEIDKEKSKTLSRWNHIGDYTQTLVGVVTGRVFSNNTPYSRGGFASVEEFSKVSRADILEHYKTHFTPKNSVLMLVGRVDKEKARKEVIKSFGTWSGEQPKREPVVLANSYLLPSKKQGGVLVKRSGRTQAQVRFGLRVPKIDHPDYYPLIVGNALLGEYFHSRLNTVIRDELALTYGIGSSISYHREFGLFSIGTSCRNEVVGQMINQTKRIIRDTVKPGAIKDEEVQMAKDYLIGSFPIEMSTLGSVASRWLAGYIYDLGPNFLNEYIPRVNAVTREQVEAAMAKHIRERDLLIIVAGEPRSIKKSLRQNKIAAFKEVSIEQLKKNR